MGIGCTHRVCTHRVAMWGLTPGSGIGPSRLVYLLRQRFGYTAYGTSPVLLCCGLATASGCVGFVVPWEGLLSRPRSATAFDCSGPPDGSYKVIRRWLVLMEVSGKDKTASRGPVIPIPSLERFSKRSSAPQGLKMLANCP